MSFLSYLYALINGYFWRACPRCGNMFGGHQCKGSIVIGTQTWATCCGEKEVLYKGKVCLVREAK